MKTFLAILALALTGILSAQEITPQRGVSFNATGILPAHDHSSPRNGAISGAAKLAVVNVGDQNTAITLDNTLDGTARAPFIQFRKRTTAGTPAAVGAVLGQLTFDSSNSAGTSSEIRSTVRVIGSDAGGWPAGSDLDFRTAPGNAVTAPQTRLYITQDGAVSMPGNVTSSSGTFGSVGMDTSAGNARIRSTAGSLVFAPATAVTAFYDAASNQTANVYNVGTIGVHLIGSGASYFNGGNVGVGIESPGNPFHVSGDTSGNVAWFESKLANSATVYIQAASGAGYIGTNGAATFALRTNTVDRVIVPNAAVTTGGALCLNASKVLSKCASAPDASGNCTCP